MEHSPIKYPGDEDVEDGEISDASDGGYIPLARPDAIVAAGACAGSGLINVPLAAATAQAAASISKMDEAFDKDVRLGDDDDHDLDSDSPDECSSIDSDSDTAVLGEPRDRQHRRRKPPAKIRIKPVPVDTLMGAAGAPSAAAAAQMPNALGSAGAGAASSTARRKNNIWATGLQEESLMENLKGCGVDRNASSAYDRDVESYDYSLRFRMNGENALKRRKSSNSDSSTEPVQTKYFRAFQHHNTKRHRGGGGGAGVDGGDGGGFDGGHRLKQRQHKRKNVHQRLGVRQQQQDDSSSNDAQLDGPRTICDLEAITAESTKESVARDLAAKLHEEKDELMLRIIEILGNELPMRVFVETQSIEANGGMMIMNGKRRRTPGGVFLFLLKNHPDLEGEHRKTIFTEESRKQKLEQKMAQAQKRDRRVEELKQSLRIENELNAWASRGPELPGASAVKDEKPNNLSNPPPSPVTDGNRELSSDFDTHDIKHLVNHDVATPEKVSPLEVQSAAAAAAAVKSSMAGTSTPVAYEDDFLDMHCDDMDMF